LGPEKIALVAQRRQHHVRAPLRADGDVEALNGDAAIDQSVKETEAVEQGAGVILLRITGGHRLRIEKIRIDEVGVLGTDVQRRGENLLVRKNVVELREGIDRPLFRFVVRKRQRAAGNFIEQILQGADEVQAIANQRTSHDEARSFIAEADHMIAADAEIGEGIVELGVPLFAAAAGFDGDHALRESAILREKGRVENVDDLDLTVGRSHINLLIFRGALLHRRLGLGDVDCGGLHLRRQDQADLQVRGIGDLDALFGSSKPCFDAVTVQGPHGTRVKSANPSVPVSRLPNT